MQIKLSNIKEEVINKIVVMSAIFFVPPYLFSLLRWFEIGWQNVFVFHTIIYFSTLGLAIYRKRFNYLQKTVLISLIYLTVSFIGLWKFALNGGFYFAIISMAILSILTKRKTAIYVNILIIILFSLVAIGYTTYMIKPVVDLNELARSPMHWSLTLFSIFSITLIFIYGFGDFYKNLTETILENEKTTAKLKLQNEVLETTEKKYQMVFDGANDAVFILKGNRFYDCNAKTSEYFKITKEELLGKKVDELSPPFQYDGQESTKKALELISQTLNNHPQQFEWQHIKSDGALFDVSVSLKKINLQGEDFIQGILRDITEKKRTDEALIESETKYKSLFENSADGILVMNEQSDILELNNQICEILGYKKEELILINGLEFIHPDDLISPVYASAIEQIEKGKTILSQYRLQKKDGSYIPTELSTKMIAEGQYLNIVRDISERVLAEKTIQESEAKYRAFFEDSMDAILLTSTDGKIHSANPAACAMFECTENEIIDFGRAGITDTTDPRIAILYSIRAEKGKASGEITMLRKDRTPFEAEISSALFENADNIKFSSMIIRDISERKQAEQSLRESEKILSVFFNNHNDLQLLVRINKDDEFFVEAINDPYINTAAKFGITIHRDEVIGQPVQTLFEVLCLDKEIYEPTITKYKKAAATGEALNYFESIEVLGQTYSSEITLNPVMHEDGKCQYILYNSHNITEKTLANIALQESEEKFKQIFLTSPDFVTISQIEDGTYLDVNDRFIETIGYSREEIIGKTAIELNIWTNIKDRERMLAQLIESGKIENLEAQFRQKDGRIIEGLLSASILLIKNKPCLLIITRDITEFKLAEKFALESQAKLHAAMDSMTDGLVISDLNGDFINFNDSFATFHKFKNKNECAKTFGEYPDILECHTPNGELVPADMWAIPRALRGETVTNSEIHLKRKDTGETWVGSYSFSPILDSEGSIVGSIVVGRDITEIKQAEEAFKETASNLRSMIDNREDSIWSIDLDFNYIIFNKTYENIINKEHNITLKRGMSSTENLTEEEFNFWVPQFQSVFEGKSVSFEFSHVLGGQKRHFRTSLNPIIEDDAITGASGLSIDITDIKLAEEALKLSEEKFEKSFRLSPYMVSLSSIEGEVIETNERVFDTLGYTRAEFLGSNTTSIPLWVNPSERENFVTLLKQNKTLDNIEVQFRKKTGEIGDYLLSACIIEVNDNRILLSIIYDITERKQKEKALQESEKRYRDLFKNSNAIMLLVDPENGNIVDANPAASQFYGWSNAELISMNLSEINTNSFEERKKVLQEASESKKNHFYFDHKIADGSLRNIEVYSASIYSKGKKLLYSIIHDITDRKQAEKDLLNEKNLLSAIVDNIPVMLARYHPNTNVLYLNKEFEDKLGWKTEELETINLIEKVYPDPIYREKAIAHMQKSNSEWEEFQIHSKTGDVFDSEWCNILLNDGTQIGIGIDITKEKNSKAEILKLNTELETKVKIRTKQLEASNKELETFTYSVSHDLKAPLRGIEGYSKLLSDIYKATLDNEAQLFIEKIRNSTLQMNQIIDDLLDYSRLERSQLSYERIQIKDLIKSVISIYHAELEAGKFKVEMNFTDTEIYADPKGIIISIRNLIENAIKFSKEKDHPVIKIEIKDEESSWIISVNDNGIGFDMKYHQKIFEIFQRLQRVEDFPGTGIGLAMVYKAMQRMNGKVWAESAPDQGSTFNIEIPKN